MGSGTGPGTLVAGMGGRGGGEVRFRGRAGAATKAGAMGEDGSTAVEDGSMAVDGGRSQAVGELDERGRRIERKGREGRNGVTKEVMVFGWEGWGWDVGNVEL